MVDATPRTKADWNEYARRVATVEVPSPKKKGTKKSDKKGK